MALGLGIGRVWPTLVLTLIAVTATMARHKDGLHVVNMVCGVLANLANGDGRCTAAVTKAGGAAAAAAALARFPDSADIQHQGDA